MLRDSVLPATAATTTLAILVGRWTPSGVSPKAVRALAGVSPQVPSRCLAVMVGRWTPSGVSPKAVRALAGVSPSCQPTL